MNKPFAVFGWDKDQDDSDYITHFESEKDAKDRADEEAKVYDRAYVVDERILAVVYKSK